jgi:hypothetical protein
VKAPLRTIFFAWLAALGKIIFRVVFLRAFYGVYGGKII